MWYNFCYLFSKLYTMTSKDMYHQKIFTLFFGVGSSLIILGMTLSLLINRDVVGAKSKDDQCQVIESIEEEKLKLDDYLIDRELASCILKSELFCHRNIDLNPDYNIQVFWGSMLGTPLEVIKMTYNQRRVDATISKLKLEDLLQKRDQGTWRMISNAKSLTSLDKTEITLAYVPDDIMLSIEDNPLVASL